MRPARGAALAPRLFVFALALGGLRDPLLFALAAAGAWRLWARARPPAAAALPWLPWLAWSVLSAALSAQPLSALAPLARWTTALACACAAASWSDEEREDWLRSLMIVALALAAAAAASGAAAGWRSNMTGLMPPYYNYTAFALAASAAAAAAWLAHPRGPRGRAAAPAAAALAAALLALALSRSRGAALGLAAAAAFWCARRWGARALAALVAAAALAFVALPDGLRDVLLKRERVHAEARPRLWRAAAEVASERPWTGTGPGAFRTGFRRHPVELLDGASRWALSTDYAHSEPLQAAAETGWAGLLLWLLGAGSALAALARRRDEDPVRDAAAAAAAAMTAQLAVDDMLHIPALLLLWLTALALSRPRRTGKSAPAPAAWAWSGAALAAAAWAPAALASRSPERAAALFPAEPGPREDLAYAAVAGRRFGEAWVHWSKAAELEPFNAVHPWRLAQLETARDGWAAAERFSARAAELEPGFASARVLRAEALWRLGRRAEARDELEALRRLRASRPEVEKGSGYERTIRLFPRADFDRVARLAGLPPLP